MICFGEKKQKLFWIIISSALFFLLPSSKNFLKKQTKRAVSQVFLNVVCHLHCYHFSSDFLWGSRVDWLLAKFHCCDGLRSLKRDFFKTRVKGISRYQSTNKCLNPLYILGIFAVFPCQKWIRLEFSVGFLQDANNLFHTKIVSKKSMELR